MVLGASIDTAKVYISSHSLILHICTFAMKYLMTDQELTLLGLVSRKAIATAAKTSVVRMGPALHQKVEREYHGMRCCLKMAMSVSNCSKGQPSQCATTVIR